MSSLNDTRASSDRAQHMNKLTVVCHGVDLDVCQTFRQTCTNHRFSKLDPLYALPSDLLAAIREELKNARCLLNEVDIQFEDDFASFCKQHHAIGIAGDILIRSSILNPPPALSDKDCRDMGWSVSAEQLATIIHKKIDPLHAKDEGYLGWLLTNPVFQRELAGVRQRREAAGRTFQIMHGDTIDEGFREFLGHWALSELSSWELPVPQSVNLTGHRWPPHITSHQPMITVQIPVTTSFSERYPLRDTIGEAQMEIVPAHLRDWQRSLCRDSELYSPTKFQQIFKLYFYRDIALARYTELIANNVQWTDRIFAAFLGRSEESIKNYRLFIDERLSR